MVWKKVIQSSKTNLWLFLGILNFRGEVRFSVHLLQESRDTVDVRNLANQLRLVVYPVIYKVSYMSGGARFLNHQQ